MRFDEIRSEPRIRGHQHLPSLIHPRRHGFQGFSVTVAGDAFARLDLKPRPLGGTDDVLAPGTQNAIRHGTDRQADSRAANRINTNRTAPPRRRIPP